MVNKRLKANAGCLHGTNLDTLAIVAQLVFNAFCNVEIIQKKISLRCSHDGAELGVR